MPEFPFLYAIFLTQSTLMCFFFQDKQNRLGNVKFKTDLEAIDNKEPDK